MAKYNPISVHIDATWFPPLLFHKSNEFAQTFIMSKSVGNKSTLSSKRWNIIAAYFFPRTAGNCHYSRWLLFIIDDLLLSFYRRLVTFHSVHLINESLPIFLPPEVFFQDSHRAWPIHRVHRAYMRSNPAVFNSPKFVSF